MNAEDKKRGNTPTEQTVKSFSMHCGRADCPRGKLFATNWLEGISSRADQNIVEVVFKNTRAGFYSNPNRIDLKIGDIVAVEIGRAHV